MKKISVLELMKLLTGKMITLIQLLIMQNKNLDIIIYDKKNKIDINKNDNKNDLKRKTEGLMIKKIIKTKKAQIPMNFMKN